MAVKRKVAASTQNQALSAILFLYREVLELELPWIDTFTKSKRPAKLPVVLNKNEVSKLLAAVRAPQHLLVLQLLYGTGMRLMECMRLRIQDIDFDRREIVIRHGKGGKDRVIILPEKLRAPLQDQINT